MLRLFQGSLLVILSLSPLCQSSCPEACEPCQPEYLYCMTQGLTEFPSSISPTLQKVTMQRQIFLNTQLSSLNFTNFKNIKQLSIRNSNINRILPMTFAALSSLEDLDLSDNADLTVSQRAFYGLNLRILKLDNMGIITIDLDAFVGLSVRSLSIQNSNLLTLPGKLLQPLSKSLLLLNLKNNQLRTLDIQLQPIFQGIETLELQKNPFICNCSLLWLIKILQLTVASKSTTEESSFSSADELFPRCVSPAEFRKKYIHTISHRLTKCDPPKIVRIDISFQSHNTAIINCFADVRKDSQKPTFLGWLLDNETNREITKMQHSLKVKRHSKKRNYLCRAGNSNGNSEIGFQIDWFKIHPPINDSNDKRKISQNIPQETRSILWRNMFSLFEMLCAIFGTLTVTVIIFLTFFCCHRCRLHIPFLEEERKFQYKIPLQYDGGVYTEHGRFYETDLDGNLFPPPPPTPPPFPSNRLLF